MILFDIIILKLLCLQLSVLAGDFLLSRACVALAALGNTEVNTCTFSSAFNYAMVLYEGNALLCLAPAFVLDRSMSLLFSSKSSMIPVSFSTLFV